MEKSVIPFNHEWDCIWAETSCSMVLSLYYSVEPLRELLISILEVFDPIGLELGPKFTFYLKFPGDASSLGSTLQEPLH